MSRLDIKRCIALANVANSMECNTDCQVACVVMHPEGDGVTCDLVAYCEPEHLVTAATHILGVARDRIDRTEPGCTAALAAIEAAMAALPCMPEMAGRASH